MIRLSLQSAVGSWQNSASAVSVRGNRSNASSAYTVPRFDCLGRAVGALADCSRVADAKLPSWRKNGKLATFLIQGSSLCDHKFSLGKLSQALSIVDCQLPTADFQLLTLGEQYAL